MSIQQTVRNTFSQCIRPILSSWTVLFFLIFLVIFLCWLMLYVFYYYDTTKTSKARFKQVVDISQQLYPALDLQQPVLQYTRQGVAQGHYIAVYQLNPAQARHMNLLARQEKFLLQENFECIKPTIKTRWLSPYLTFHYVQPPEYAKDHQDYEVHDSFIVHGSDQYIGQVAASCKFSQQFQTDPAGPDRFSAVRQHSSQRIIFSSARISYNPHDHMLFIDMVIH